MMLASTIPKQRLGKQCANSVQHAENGDYLMVAGTSVLKSTCFEQQ
ncbi:hypothetical protein [Vreelandella olivaria]|nr:hypothetical protein [Halomonas olivaria]